MERWLCRGEILGLRQGDGVKENFQAGMGKRGRTLREEWFAKVGEYKARYPELADQLEAEGYEKYVKAPV